VEIIIIEYLFMLSVHFTEPKLLSSIQLCFRSVLLNQKYAFRIRFWNWERHAPKVGTRNSFLEYLTANIRKRWIYFLC